MKKYNKKIIASSTLIAIILLVFSFSNIFATTIEITRNFSNTFNKNSQNSPILQNHTYTNGKLLLNQGGSAHFSYSDGALSAGNSVNIDTPQKQKTEQKVAKKIVVEERNKKIQHYRVVSGDTISEISEKFKISQKTIIIENNLKNKKLSIGQKLIILPVSGLRHTVKSGDTVSELAQKYSSTVQKIKEFNQISGNSLKIGKKIIIPGGKREVSRTRTSKKTSETTSRNNRSSNRINLVGDGNISKFLRSRGIVPYGMGAKILVPKRTQGRIRYTETDFGFFTHPAPGSVRTQGIHGWNSIDMGAPTGTNIYAAAAGQVIKTYFGGWGGGYGNHILIEHSNGVITMYAHNLKNLVSRGQKVKKGELIAKMGSTGRSTGPHLHFEVRGAYNPF